MSALKLTSLFTTKQGTRWTVLESFGGLNATKVIPIYFNGCPFTSKTLIFFDNGCILFIIYTILLDQ